MTKMHCTYGPPPDSDSDESYDGFYFDTNETFKRERPKSYIPKDQKLYDALKDGDVEVVSAEIDALSIHVDDSVRGGFTMLLHACAEGHYNLAEYLIVKRGANVNKQVDSDMPLMKACDCRRNEPQLVERLVNLLLRSGAVINVSDKYGMTPFMFACRNGYTSVVRLLLKDVSFDAVDNQGCTSIFHAVEMNRPDIVKLLVDAGVNATIANNKGYTPTQVAEFHGFYDLLDILPRKSTSYQVPSQFLGYSKLSDHIPRIFLKTECPEYFQDLNTILYSINMQNMLEHFAKARVSLGEFLVMDEKKLQDVGIEMPLYRNKIMKGILDFHLHHWSKKSIARIKKDGMNNFYEILMITGNHLQHLVILQSSIRFVIRNQEAGNFGKLTELQLANFQSNLKAYREVINDLKKTVKYLASFSPPKNPLHIDYNEILAQRKRNKVRKIFKYTTIILGISVFVCLKCKFLF
ncbi:transient receptor potential cation channel subfamily A member 1 [Scaptodrosophila lebanonensis]|uniref:Transient receptor potential cation channel subfamily A member 1 n=1 Tax=Drosophila lebanonensis TaxID=7225 RepID=A0A6J2UJV3_DROLE|nr:transient receptor potential cation channel subfamily A member 1 [Scaptodrosophila lebanonensis]